MTTKNIYLVPMRQDFDDVGESNFCIDCRWFAPVDKSQKKGICGRFPDLLNAEDNDARLVRYDEHQCGRQGRGFEPLNAKAE
jgi:hypothetical protein